MYKKLYIWLFWASLMQWQTNACPTYTLSVVQEEDETPPTPVKTVYACPVNHYRFATHGTWGTIFKQIDDIEVEAAPEHPSHLAALLFDIDCTMIREPLVFSNTNYLPPQSLVLVRNTIKELLYEHFQIKEKGVFLYILYDEFKKDCQILFDEKALKRPFFKYSLRSLVIRHLRFKIKQTQEKLDSLSGKKNTHVKREKRHLYNQLLELERDLKQQVKQTLKRNPDKFYIPHWVLMDERLPEKLQGFQQKGWKVFAYTSRPRQWEEIAPAHLKHLGIDLVALNKGRMHQNPDFTEMDIPHPISLHHNKQVIFINGVPKKEVYPYVVKAFHQKSPQVECITTVHVDDSPQGFFPYTHASSTVMHHQKVTLNHAQIHIYTDYFRHQKLPEMLRADIQRFDFINKFRNYLRFRGIDFVDLK